MHKSHILSSKYPQEEVLRLRYVAVCEKYPVSYVVKVLAKELLSIIACYCLNGFLDNTSV